MVRVAGVWISTRRRHSKGGALDAEFSWSERKAAQFIAVARAFNAPSLVTSGLSIEAGAFYALSAPGVPEAARTEAIEKDDCGRRAIR
jgi:molybdopterin-biosynthesis enzyme MoeA-like protein